MRKIILTCAVTGSFITRDKNDAVPVTPQEIIKSCLDAHAAGAAVVHIHVRDPETGRPSTEFHLYEEVVKGIRASGSEVVINLTTGPGQHFRNNPAKPIEILPESSLLTPQQRVEHVVRLKPDICSLDVCSFNRPDHVVVNSLDTIRLMAGAIRDAGVKPELEVFDTGQMGMVADLQKEGYFKDPLLFSFVLGTKYTAPATPQMVSCFANLAPANSVWTAFGTGPAEFTMAALSLAEGGQVRVGLEDNLYIRRGIKAKSNAELVTRAAQLIDILGFDLASPADAREMLGIG